MFGIEGLTAGAALMAVIWCLVLVANIVAFRSNHRLHRENIQRKYNAEKK